MTQLPPDVEAAVRRAEELTARRYEPLLRAAARHGGGWVDGDRGDRIAHSVKGAERLAEKIAPAVERGTPVDRALLTVSDINRYTVVFEEARYTDGVRRFQEYLADRGVLLDAGKNTWNDPFYKGYNARLSDTTQPHVAVDPADATDTSPRHLLEVQAHTPESLTAKQDNHDLYKVARAGRTSKRVQEAANELQARRNDTVATPPDAEALGTQMPARARPDPTPEAFTEVEAALRELREGHARDRAAGGVPPQRTPPGPPAADRHRLTPERSPAGSREHGDHDRPDLTRADPDRDSREVG